MYHSSALTGLLISASICWLWYSHVSLGATSPIVRIKNGTLEGTVMRSRKGREFAAFRGIPYAQPPLGQLRFEPPKPFDSWTGVRSAKKDGNVCLQRNSPPDYELVFGSEDCLYLNVYSPKVFLDGKQCSNHSVMIWFHGGGWTVGSSHSSLYGPTFFLDHDIVLVTVNYRLGALGFLSTGDLRVPGNQGLKDQAQSIRWVHENIVAFGGDPNLVTIFGESAGALAVHYHMISPLSRGFFHRAISQSGALDCPWVVFRPEDARDRTNRLGERLDCPTGVSKALIDCLKRKNADDFVMLENMFQIFNMCPLAQFRPVIEPDHPGAFLKEDPIKILKSGNAVDIPWITGFNSQEGALRVASLYGMKHQGLNKILDENFMELAPVSLLYEATCPTKFKENVTKSIRKFYLGDKKIDESTRMDMVDMYTDAWFHIGIDTSVRIHLETLRSPVYYYYLAYRGSLSQNAAFGDPDRDYGVGHGDDLQYFFPVNKLFAVDSQYGEENWKMVDLMTTLWVNFAGSGDPTPEKAPKMPVRWKPVRTSALEYLYIGGLQDLRMEANLLPERREFWSSIPYRSKIEDEYDSSRTREEL